MLPRNEASDALLHKLAKEIDGFERDIANLNFSLRTTIESNEELVRENSELKQLVAANEQKLDYLDGEAIMNIKSNLIKERECNDHVKDRDNTDAAVNQQVSEDPSKAIADLLVE
jgi:hypothetical protein